MLAEQAMVKEFHKKFGLPLSDHYREMSPEEAAFRVGFVLEEASELAQAALKGDTPEMVDALCDLLYVVHGTALFMGLDLEPFFSEVHRTNMNKVGGATDSKGKVLKPPGWQKPDIEHELGKQGW